MNNKTSEMKALRENIRTGRCDSRYRYNKINMLGNSSVNEVIANIETKRNYSLDMLDILTVFAIKHGSECVKD